MKIRFAIATASVVVILLIGAVCAVQLANDHNPLTGFLAGIFWMMAAAGTYYLLSPDQLAKRRAAVSEAAATTLSRPEVHQGPVLSREMWLWLKEHPTMASGITSPGTTSDSTSQTLPTGLRHITAAELLELEESGQTPYAIVSESTGGYAVIEGEVYLTADGEFVHIEVEMGVLRLPLDEEADAITVAENRGAAVRLER